MANITRIKASDEGSDKKKETTTSKPEKDAVVRKVSVKAKNTENKKVAAAKAKKQQEIVKAEKKAVKEKRIEEDRNVKRGPIRRFLRWLFTPLRAIGRYIRDSFRELRQVRWPDRKTSWKLTASVIVYVLIFAVFMMLLDALLTYISNIVLGGNN